MYRRIFEAVTAAVEYQVKCANQQVRDTKIAFGLPSSSGLLVVLNDQVDVITPFGIADRVAELFWKRKKGGEPRFPHITAALIIGETHALQLTREAALTTFPLVSLRNVDAVVDRNRIEEFVASLAVAWAQANGGYRLVGAADVFAQPKRPPLGPIRKEKKPSELKVHEVRRLWYRANPYLRRLSPTQFLEYGSTLIIATGTTTLKARPAIADAYREELVFRWTDLLEEVNVRGVDMRAFNVDELRAHKTPMSSERFKQLLAYLGIQERAG